MLPTSGPFHDAHDASALVFPRVTPDDISAPEMDWVSLALGVAGAALVGVLVVIGGCAALHHAWQRQRIARARRDDLSRTIVALRARAPASDDEPAPERAVVVTRPPSARKRLDLRRP